MNNKSIKILVTGSTGFLGHFVCKELSDKEYDNVVAIKHQDYNLTREQDVAKMYADHDPDVVVHLAAKVGGIGANKAHPGLYFYENMAMGMHLIEHARINNITKFVQVGTVCSYPKYAAIPFKESQIWNGYPEETNAPYGIAKKALGVMLQSYKQEYGLNSAYVIPVNLYGPGDNFDTETSHVIPALIKKCRDAIENKQTSITCWGTGSPSREFLYVEDAARAIVLAMEKIEDPVPINLGTGEEIKMDVLATLVARMCEFDGQILWDDTHPDGQPRRCLDINRSKLLLEWEPSIGLRDGLAKTIEWYENWTL